MGSVLVEWFARSNRASSKNACQSALLNRMSGGRLLSPLNTLAGSRLDPVRVSALASTFHRFPETPNGGNSLLDRAFFARTGNQSARKRLETSILPPSMTIGAGEPAKPPQGTPLAPRIAARRKERPASHSRMPAAFTGCEPSVVSYAASMRQDIAPGPSA